MEIRLVPTSNLVPAKILVPPSKLVSTFYVKVGTNFHIGTNLEVGTSFKVGVSNVLDTNLKQGLRSKQISAFMMAADLKWVPVPGTT